MSKRSFYELCDLLRPWLQRKNTCLREISVEAQVGAYVYYISNEGQYLKTANAFGVSCWSISSIIRSFTCSYDLSRTAAYKITKDRDESKRTG